MCCSLCEREHVCVKCKADLRKHICDALICFAVKQKNLTALIHATFHGRVDCLRLLLDAGANKEVRSLVRDFAVLVWGMGGWKCMCVVIFIVRFGDVAWRTPHHDHIGLVVR